MDAPTFWIGLFISLFIGWIVGGVIGCFKKYPFIKGANEGMKWSFILWFLITLHIITVQATKLFKIIYVICKNKKASV